jgi:hypothetical protein
MRQKVAVAAAAAAAATSSGASTITSSDNGLRAPPPPPQGIVRPWLAGELQKKEREAEDKEWKTNNYQGESIKVDNNLVVMSSLTQNTRHLLQNID